MSAISRRGHDRQRRRPAMVDVARHAGVSLKTVSRVVNNAPHRIVTLPTRLVKRGIRVTAHP